MNDVQMHPDDYVLWLKGMFDTIGDRTPTPEEWARFREQNVMQVGDVVMRRVEEREIAHKEKLRRAEEEAMRQAKFDAEAKWLQMQKQMYQNAELVGALQVKPIQPLPSRLTAAAASIAGKSAAGVILDEFERATDSLGSSYGLYK